jgi:hypothetical protein
MFNLSPSRKKFFKIDTETTNEIPLEHVSQQNNFLYMSRNIILKNGDLIKIIDLDGFEETRQVLQSSKELYRQKVTLL